MNNKNVFVVLYCEKGTFSGVEGVFDTKKMAQTAIDEIKDLPECEKLDFYIQKAEYFMKEET